MIERTLSIIKPDATKRRLIGKITTKLEEAGLEVIAQKRIQLSLRQAEQFYLIHKSKNFFRDLIEFMISYPIVVMVLEGENAVEKYRKLMGKTNPEEAEEGTIRREFALNIQENGVHGSDSLENAEREIRFFFSETELIY